MIDLNLMLNSTLSSNFAFESTIWIVFRRHADIVVFCILLISDVFFDIQDGFSTDAPQSSDFARLPGQAPPHRIPTRRMVGCCPIAVRARACSSSELVSDKHVRGNHRDEEGWRVYDKRYWRGDRLGDHLTFAFGMSPSIFWF